MNSIADLYTLKLKINGSSSYIGPTDADLSVSDSIYAVYPRAMMTLKDLSGIFLESRLATLGVDFEFTIGYQSEETRLPFVVNNFQTPDQDYLQFLNGELEMEFIHEFFVKFQAEYKAYELMPSDIIDSIIKKEKFKNKFIGTTMKLQDTPYYNPGYSFLDFLNKIILPNALSSQYQHDSYYCFIDSSNSFHFETIADMYSRKAFKTLVYRIGRKDINEVNKVLEFRPFSLQLDKTYPNISYRHSFIEEDNPTVLETVNYEMTDNKQSPLPIFKPSNLFTTVFGGFSSDEDKQKAEVQINLQKRNNDLMDRIAVTTLMDTSVCAGKIVQLDTDYDSGNMSGSYSGDYLVEGTNHYWDSSSMKGFTQMILSRQKATFPVGSKLTGGLLS